MKRLIPFFCFLGLLSAMAAQDTTSVDRDADSGLLWKISGRGMPQPSYLFGTIHLISKEDFSLSDSVLQAISRVEQVVFEIDMLEMENITMQIGLLSKSMMSGNQTLRDLLTDEEYALVKEHFGKLGLPIIFLERMKPLFLSMLAEMDFSTSLTSGQMLSYEMEIMHIAQRKEKSIGGLETAEYQMSLFDSIPYTDQAKMLVQAIETSGSGKGAGEFDKMVELYKSGDIEAMTELMSGEDDFSQYEGLLLHRRNRNWIPVMERMMAEQPGFFAVGAGHLGGDQGVIALLREAGFTVKAVR